MELNSFLTSIADAIRSKKGTTDKINASNFASEIASISGGGGAVIKTIGGWQGTAVPNTGYVENVYFNTNLSVGEVNALLDNITFVEGNEYFIANETGSKMIIGLNASFITEGAITGYIIAGMTDSGIIPIFNGSIEDLALEFFGVAFTEWYSDFNGVFEFNDTAIAGMEGMIFGSQNGELTSLLSTTSFVKTSGESINLTGEYDGSNIKVIENGKLSILNLIENKQIPLSINVKIPIPSGTFYINENNIYDITNYGKVDVNVPIPPGYIIPRGNIEITSTRSINVSNYETAQVVDDNLSAKNIIKGVSILGISGTYTDDKSVEDSLILNTITNYSNDRITYTGFGAFYNKTKLASVSLPNVTKTKGSTFENCTKLTNVSMPKLTQISGSDFEYCSSLVTLKFPLVSQILGSSVFAWSTSLTDIYFGYSGVIYLADPTTAFEYARQKLKIHVRSEYVEQYTNDTNWSTLINNGKIVIVGDYTD